jgi:hypothetical protein
MHPGSLPSLKRWFRNSLLPALLLLPVCSQAQTNGLGLWTGASADIRLAKKWSLNVNTQVRFSDNIQVTRAYLGELGLSYKLSKHWAVSGYYRYTGRLKKNKEEGGYYYRPYHRFYGELNYDQKIGQGLKLEYRLRYQNQFKDDNTAVIADKSYLRNKLELSYGNPSRFTPFVSADLFYRIDNTDNTGGFDQIRYKAGTNIRLAKAHSLDLFVFTDAALRNSGEDSGPILGATYKLKLGRRSAKKKE